MGTASDAHSSFRIGQRRCYRAAAEQSRPGKQKESVRRLSKGEGCDATEKVEDCGQLRPRLRSNKQ